MENIRKNQNSEKGGVSNDNVPQATQAHEAQVRDAVKSAKQMAEEYKKRGIVPVPMEWKDKITFVKNWPKRTLETVDINSEFSGNKNVLF